MQTQSEKIEGSQKSGKEVAKSQPSKLTSMYWGDRVFRPTYVDGDGTSRETPTFYARIQHAGRREAVNLGKSDKGDAARTAAKLYGNIRAQGWDAALRLHDPDKYAPKSGITVGDIVKGVESAGLNDSTANNYKKAIRWWAARHLDLTPKKSTYGPKGSAQWHAKLDAVHLSKFSKERVGEITADFIAAAGRDAMSIRAASNSIAFFIRNTRAALTAAAKSGTILPSPRPFDDVKAPGTAKSSKYVSTFNASDLLRSAKTELLETDRDVYLAILLALGAGLRRGELSNLRWRNVRNDSIIVAAGGPWQPKTSESEARVWVSKSLLDEIEPFRADDNDFVLSSESEAEQDRCKDLMGRVNLWLRGHGVDTFKPTHTLRKEFGSIVSEAADLFTASRQLRHSSLSVTAMHYVENRKRVAPDIGGMLATKKDEVKQ